MTTYLSTMILGALWRIYDGTGKFLPGSARVALGGAAMIFIIGAVHGTPSGWEMWTVYLLTITGALLSLVMGYKDWTLFDRAQVLHYYPALLGPAASLVVWGPDKQWLAIPCVLAAGLAHPTLAWFADEYWPTLHYTRIAEGVVGAAIFLSLTFI